MDADEAGPVPAVPSFLMDALLLKEYMKLEMIEMDVPEIGPDDLLVRVRACGICGSDVHGMDGSTGRRLPPIVMGHEAAGVVERAGANVRDLKAGDRVTFDSTIYCGQCFHCGRGEVNLCDNRMVLGVSPGEYRRHGAFAEYVAVPRRIVYALPDSLSFEQAALIEAASVAVHGVGLTPVKLGDRAVVVGAGMIGVLTVQALRASGCANVIAIDPVASRLKMAEEFGATETRTSGDGIANADVVLECVGANESVQTALKCVRKGGAVTLVGNFAPKVELPLQWVVSRQIRVQGSCASSGEYPAVIDLMARGTIRVNALISAVAPLREGAEWFGKLYRREGNLMKVILQP
jgi:L-iditol 2-dehydrogenase